MAGGANDYVRGNHTLRTQSYEPPLKTLRPHFQLHRDSEAPKNNRGEKGGVKGRHGMCVCPQQRHKCFTNAAQTLRQELIKKKCAQHEKQLKKLFLHNNITCQNCSLEKYFAIFGCEFLHKMSATSKTFRRCLFFFFFALGSRLVVSPRTPWAKANATDPPLQRGS